MNLYNFKRIFILSNGNKNNSCSERKKETFFFIHLRVHGMQKLALTP